jgi:hypothetical protein
MIDTYNILFALTCAEGAVGFACIGGALFYRRRWLAVLFELRRREDLSELANDALANVEDLESRLAEASAEAGRWAGKYILTRVELSRLKKQHDADAQRKRDHMRRIAVLGNQSPKRKRQAA